MKKIIIDADNGNQRIDKFLKRYLPNAGAGFLYRMLREKKIKLNDSKCDGAQMLHEGDEIKIFFSDETMRKFMGISENTEKTDAQITDSEIIKFKKCIIAESEQILLLNKPAGMLSQKAETNDISACELLVEYLKSKNELDSEKLRLYKPSAVNRIDRNTSGLLICAKTLGAAQLLTRLIKERDIKKEYLCLVKGHITNPDSIEAFILKDKASNKVTVVSKNSDKRDINGQYDIIKTSYKPIGYEDGATLLEVELITGKTHQIRAQLSALGHPLAGDIKYGDKAFNRSMKEGFSLQRQYLHAFRLTFPKDRSLGEMFSGKSYTAPLPDDLIRPLVNCKDVYKGLLNGKQ